MISQNAFLSFTEYRMRLSLCLDPFQEINRHLIWWLHHISLEHTQVIQLFQNVSFHYTSWDKVFYRRWEYFANVRYGIVKKNTTVL